MPEQTPRGPGFVPGQLDEHALLVRWSVRRVWSRPPGVRRGRCTARLAAGSELRQHRVGVQVEQRDELERVIAERQAAGDLAAAATVAIKGYGPEILGFLFVSTGRQQETAEIFSDYCEDLWRGLPAFRGESSFRTWSYRLAYHALARARRSDARKRKRVTALTELPEIAGVVDHVRTRTLPHLRTEVKTAVARLRERLSEEDRTLLVLRIDRRLPWDEIAGIVDPDSPSPESSKRLAAALRQRFERIKARLRELAVELGLQD